MEEVMTRSLQNLLLFQVPIVPCGGATSIEGHTLSPNGGVFIYMSLMKGHAEHASGNVDYRNFLRIPAYVQCKISAYINSPLHDFSPHCCLLLTRLASIPLGSSITQKEEAPKFRETKTSEVSLLEKVGSMLNLIKGSQRLIQACGQMNFYHNICPDGEGCSEEQFGFSCYY